MGIYLGSWVTGAMALGIGAVVLLFAVAVPAFGVQVYAATLVPAVATLVLGAGCLAALGVAVASLAKTADQAQPVAQLTFLPLSFISGIWYPLDGAPDWIVQIAHVFPLYHLAQAFGGCFVPGGGWEPRHLAVLVAWTAGALVVAARRFRWEP
jgi:ABC-2 type transport system permease protein